MALERKDVRFKMDPDAHAGLTKIASHDGMELAEWCEMVINNAVADRIHDANVLSKDCEGLVIPGISRSFPGKPKTGA